MDTNALELATLHIFCNDCIRLPAHRACLRHTCIDCGQPTLIVHGSDGQPCPTA